MASMSPIRGTRHINRPSIVFNNQREKSLSANLPLYIYEPMVRDRVRVARVTWTWDAGVAAAADERASSSSESRQPVPARGMETGQINHVREGKYEGAGGVRRDQSREKVRRSKIQPFKLFSILFVTEHEMFS
jgi:hypothetical protein